MEATPRKEVFTPVVTVAKEGDIQEISNLINLTYSGYSGKKGWTTEADLLSGQKVTPKAIGEILSNPNKKILVSRGNKLLLGCVFLEKRDKSIYLSALTVNPNFQRKNIGSKLLSSSETFSSLFWKIYNIEMTVLNQRHELLEWYKKRGYKDFGLRLPFPYWNKEMGIPKIGGLEFVVLTKFF